MGPRAPNRVRSFCKEIVMFDKARLRSRLPIRGIGAIAVAAIIAFLGGCATAPPPKETKMVWPPPPLPTRIQFVRTITSEKDLNSDTTFTENLAAFLTGEKLPSGRIAEPAGLAVSEDGERLYVSDMMQQAVFAFDFKNRKFTKLGNVGVPSGIALDAQENLYVVDTARKAVAVFGRDGKQLNEFSDPEVDHPNGIAIDKARGRIYVVDTGSRAANEQNVKIYDLKGHRIGAIGSAPGADLGQFSYPTYVAVDAQGFVYVSDTLNARVQKFDAEGKFVTTFGQLGTNWGEFDKPKGIAVDSFGNLYVVDSGWSNVQIFNPKGQVLLFFGGRGPVPGMLKNPLAVAIDKNNRIYVGDYLNHRIGVYDLVNTTATDSFLNPPPNPQAKKK
jgi:DNA-binding beta-propeller fold protein YncE